MQESPIDIVRLKDFGFIKEVEEESGQTVSNCYQCGNCTAGCPAGFTYDLQTNQIMRGVQLGLRDKVLHSEAIWMCLSCSTCSLRCPNNIDVAAVMETLRHMARREGYITEARSNKFWMSFLNTVEAFGRSYELGTMALYYSRSFYLFRSLFGDMDIELAPGFISKGKLGYLPHVTPDGGNKAVGRIFKRYRERCKKEGVRP